MKIIQSVVVLKKTQNKDIKKAIEYWLDYLKEIEHG